jgi:trehalose utilization protein
MSDKIRVLCWTDASGLHTQQRPIAYEEGIHNVLADLLNASGEFEATAAATDDEVFQSFGLSQYDVLMMWAHGRPVSLEAQHNIVRHVEAGRLGLVGLHSVLMFPSYPILVGRLLGQTARYGWEDGVPMRFTVAAKDHPIFGGIESFELSDEAYYEPFGLVEGAEVLLTMEVREAAPRRSQLYNHALGRYEQVQHHVEGLVSRAAWTYRAGEGRVVYFQPGHETDPTYRDPLVQEVLCRAARWVAPQSR